MYNIHLRYHIFMLELVTLRRTAFRIASISFPQNEERQRFWPIAATIILAKKEIGLGIRAIADFLIKNEEWVVTVIRSRKIQTNEFQDYLQKVETEFVQSIQYSYSEQ